MRSNRYLFAPVFFGLLARLAVLLLAGKIGLLHDLVAGGDAVGYAQLADQLLHAHRFAFGHGELTAFRMPGYPLFLALAQGIGSSFLLAQVFQIFIDLVTIALVYALGMRITKNRRVSLLAATAYAVYPLLIVSAVSLLPETLTIFLLTAAMYGLLRADANYGFAPLAGLALGLAIYLKPTVAPLAVALLATFALHWLLRRPGGTRIGMQAVLPLLLVGTLLLPWLARNWIVLDAFIPLTTSSGSNMYGGNNPRADGGFVSADPYVLPGRDEVESNRIFNERATTWIKENPGAFVALLPAKAARFLWPLSLGTTGTVSLPPIAFWPLLALVVCFYGVAGYGMWMLLVVNRRWWEGLLLVEMPLVLLLLSLIAFGAARFALPAFPALALLAAIGVETLWQPRANWPAVSR